MPTLFSRRRREPEPQSSIITPESVSNTGDDTQSQEDAQYEKDSFPNGIRVLAGGQDPVVDICFVHGLTGSRMSTWTAEGESVPWPVKLLAPSLPNARILTFGYDAYVVRRGVAGTNSLAEHAANLLADIADERATAPSRPLFFVAHSLGGLVCKRAVLSAQNNAAEHLRSVFSAIKGIIFLGTPHQGSWMADWSRIPAHLLGVIRGTNKSLLDILNTQNQFLRAIQQDFLNMLRNSAKNEGEELQIMCFYEELPLPLVGKVVSQDSATFSGYQLRSIPANHSDMVKFVSEDDTGFKRVYADLRRWTQEVSRQSNPSDLSSVINEIMNMRVADAEVDIQAVELWSSQEYDLVTEAERRCFIQCAAALSVRLQLTRLVKYDKILFQIDVLCEGDLPSTTRQKYQSARKEYVEKSQGIQAEIEMKLLLASERCLRWLAFEGLGFRAEAISRPVASTCEWIYEHEHYNWWTAAANRLLWIIGKPGSGKSVLMKSLHAKRRLRSAQYDVLLDFFFNARGAETEKRPLGLYSTLLAQFCRQHQGCLFGVLQRFLEKEERLKPAEVSWQSNELYDLLHEMINSLPPLTIEIFIDALDECHSESVRAVIRDFEELIDTATRQRTNLRICWSSRYYPQISMNCHFRRELLLDHFNNPDVHAYVCREFGFTKSQDMLTIRDQVIARAKGIFLWATLATARIREDFDHGATPTELQQVLGELPRDLDDHFDLIMARVRRRRTSVDELRRLAQWLFCSPRPLSLKELCVLWQLHECEIPFEISSLELSRERLLSFKDRIVAVSGGLLEVVNVSKQEAWDSFRKSGYRQPMSIFRRLNSPSDTSDSSSSDDGGSPGRSQRKSLFEDFSVGIARVQVIHESVREYFLGSKGRRLLSVGSNDSFYSNGLRMIFRVCLKGLSATEFWPPSDKRTHPATFDIAAAIYNIWIGPIPGPIDAVVVGLLWSLTLEHMRSLRMVCNTDPGLFDTPGLGYFASLDLRDVQSILDADKGWQRLAFRNLIRVSSMLTFSNWERSFLNLKEGTWFGYARDELRLLERVGEFFNTARYVLEFIGLGVPAIMNPTRDIRYLTAPVHFGGDERLSCAAVVASVLNCTEMLGQDLDIYLAGQGSFPEDLRWGDVKLYHTVRFAMGSQAKKRSWKDTDKSVDFAVEPVDAAPWGPATRQRLESFSCVDWTRDESPGQQASPMFCMIFDTFCEPSSPPSGVE